MSEHGDEADNANLLLEELRAIHRLIEERLPSAPPPPSYPSHTEAAALALETERREAKEFPGRRVLIQEIEQQSDTGPIDVDHLLRGYDKEYREPVRMLLQDLQQRAEIYHNLFEQLKNSSDPKTAARDLKSRYLALGLIETDNAWPNPWGKGLMDLVNKKLDRLCDAILKLLRTEMRSLLRELNFEPTIKVGVEFALSMSGPQVTITLEPEPAS
jgi:hypothetical protein